jgi:alpha-ketoglutarate-dependent taurine dioxygenase
MAKELPLIIEADRNRNISEWIVEHRTALHGHLEQYGAILLRGFDIDTESRFVDCIKTFSDDIVEYVYRSTPRTALGGGVYTATEYPAGLSIPLHNENAYQRKWPLNLLFLCISPAEGGGGQTPLARTVNVTERIDVKVRTRFMERNVMYIRNYRDEIDLPWRTVFQTNSKSEVEQYCRNHDIVCEWYPPDNLRTKQVCQAFAKHPRTGVSVWFNQAHLFHPSALDMQSQRLIRSMFKEDELPRNATYGDGSPINDHDLEGVKLAFKSEMMIFEWRPRDLLILDNMLVSHGRTPFRGNRRLLTGMCNSSRAVQLGE